MQKETKSIKELKKEQTTKFFKNAKFYQVTLELSTHEPYNLYEQDATEFIVNMEFIKTQIRHIRIDCDLVIIYFLSSDVDESIHQFKNFMFRQDVVELIDVCTLLAPVDVKKYVDELILQEG